VAFNRKCFFSKTERLLTVTGSHIRCESEKWCKIDKLLIHTTNRKCHMAYQFVPFSMTLDDHEDCMYVGVNLQCFDTVGWTTGRASGL